MFYYHHLSYLNLLFYFEILSIKVFIQIFHNYFANFKFSYFQFTLFFIVNHFKFEFYCLRISIIKPSLQIKPIHYHLKSVRAICLLKNRLLDHLLQNKKINLNLNRYFRKRINFSYDYLSFSFDYFFLLDISTCNQFYLLSALSNMFCLLLLHYHREFLLLQRLSLLNAFYRELDEQVMFFARLLLIDTFLPFILVNYKFSF